MSIEKIIDLLQSTQAPAFGFNPYKDICPEHDLPNASAIRCENLKLYLNAQLELKPKSLWLGEAPGYNGVRRSGLYLLSEPQLDMLSDRLKCLPFQKATKTAPKATSTSKQVWKMIELLPEVPLTLDAYPFHLVQEKLPFANRSPKKAELKDYAPLLEFITDLFQPEIIIAIGRKAEYALNHIGIKAQYVRHPSRGGQREFEKGIKRIYQI